MPRNGSTPVGSRRVFAIVFGDADYRALFGALFLNGFGIGVAAPFLSLWVVHILHGTTADAALMYVPQGLVGVVAGMILAAYTDRHGRRKAVMLGGWAISATAWFAMSLIANYHLALVLSGVNGLGGGGLMFALLGDVIRHKEATGLHPPGAVGMITTLERTAFSLGFLFGPVVGGLLAASAGYAIVFRLTAGIFLLTLAWGGWQLVDPGRVRATTAGQPGALTTREAVLLALLAGTGVSLMVGDTGRSMFLPLLLTVHLHLPVQDVSFAFSLTVVGELILMPLAGSLADRWGVVPVFVTGVAAQAVFFFALSRSTRYWEVLALQLLYAGVISTTTGVAIVFSQRVLSHSRLNLATTTYQSMRGLAPFVNSGIVLMVGSVIPRVFSVMALMAVLGLIMIVVIERAKPKLAGPRGNALEASRCER